MQPLTPEGQRRVSDLSQRYFVSTDAVMTLLQALVNGNGTMAQFYHPELGGAGQWMQGGMTMIGDMFNSALKSKVEGLCAELSNLLASQPFAPAPASYPAQGGQQQQQGGSGVLGGSPVSLFVPASGGGAGSWWPGELGAPSSSGSQNNIRYAVFPGARRLAVDVDGRVSVYDTLDHQIGGVSQQQGSGSSVTFSSQYGVVGVQSLPLVSGDAAAQQAPGAAPPPVPAQAAVPRASSGPEADIFSAIERLADLRQKGIITEQEFAAKKADLLSRL
ncbi:SHOCT domain-containing protein [Sorangium sp. So ce185]|uniref:SHOCT domain-containing protein n=1 Tax=Sorangium sp. So ce185 TaxID=3133287 RepID=UPI003F5F4B69